MDMVEYARSKGLYTRFNTNFSVVNDEIIERLVTSGHSEITISMESNDPDTFADVRRGTTLATVMGRLQKLLDARRLHNSKTPKILVYSILMKCVLPHIFDLIKTVKAMGVDHVTVTDLNTEGIDLEARLRDDSRIADQILLNFMPEEEVWEIIRQIKSYEDANFEVVVPGQYGGLKGSAKAGTAILTCEELWELPFVTCDGYVIPCCWASHPSIFNMGNISEHRFEDIWFGSPYRRLRFQHIMNQHPTYCLRCQQLVWTIAEQSKFRGQSRSEHCHRRCFLNLRSRMRLAQETPKRFP
jgi:radical SAM protein with 4Fe4S-binding SPASM domain